MLKRDWDIWNPYQIPKKDLLYSNSLLKLVTIRDKMFDVFFFLYNWDLRIFSALIKFAVAKGSLLTVYWAPLTNFLRYLKRWARTSL